MKNLHFPVLLLAAAGLALASCDQKPATPAPAGGGAVGGATAAGGAAKGDGHDHDHAHGDAKSLGEATIGAYSVKVVSEEAIKPGAEAHVNITLSGSTDKPAAVRMWVGSEDGKGAMKSKADLETGTTYHGHVDVPSPIPAAARLWIEIEDAKGAKATGSVALGT